MEKEEWGRERAGEEEGWRREKQGEKEAWELERDKERGERRDLEAVLAALLQEREAAAAGSERRGRLDYGGPQELGGKEGGEATDHGPGRYGAGRVGAQDRERQRLVQRFQQIQSGEQGRGCGAVKVEREEQGGGGKGAEEQRSEGQTGRNLIRPC